MSDPGFFRGSLVASNRQAGAYKGWVTRWKNKFEAAELEIQKLEIEKKQLVHDKKGLADQIREISGKFQDMGKTLAKLQAFEAAVDHLTEMKAVADEQQRSAGYWSAKAVEDLNQAVEIFLETVDEIIHEDLNDNTQREVV